MVGSHDHPRDAVIALVTSKYAMTSKVRYDEKCALTSKVRHSERWSAISDCVVNNHLVSSHQLNVSTTSCGSMYGSWLSLTLGHNSTSPLSPSDNLKPNLTQSHRESLLTLCGNVEPLLVRNRRGNDFSTGWSGP